TDVFYPGWKAYVDGAGAEVYRVDGLVRGVFLKKGSHRVEFVYRPFSFMAGAALFVIGVVAVLVLLVKRRN
ncbi:MAG TPA: YfhO family protein, partial [Thermodesulfobacteriota bacterium]